jgi:hypothetical protein
LIYGNEGLASEICGEMGISSLQLRQTRKRAKK